VQKVVVSARRADYTRRTNQYRRCIVSANQILPTAQHYAEVVTGATVTVWAICPNCKIAAAVAVNLDPELRVSPTASELHVKAKSKGMPHVCGQLPFDLSVVVDQAKLDELTEVAR
jgi:hypothetical protein